MLSRGCPCLRSRRLSAVLDNVAVGTDEPLLFLYPSWFTSALGQHRSASSITTTTNSRRPRISDRCPNRRSCPPRDLSVGSSSRRWFSSASSVLSKAVVQTDNPSQNATEDTGQSIATETVANEKESSVGCSMPATGSTDTLDRSSSTRDHLAVMEEQGRDAIVESDPGFNPVESLQSSSEANGPSQGGANPVVHGVPSDARDAKPPVRLRSLGRLPPKEQRLLRYRIYMKKRGRDFALKSYQGPWTDMMTLLERMQEETRVWPEGYQKELQIPEEMVALLAGLTEIGENVWFVPILNGCRVHVLSATENDSRRRKVVLSGSERVVELVESRIMRLQRLQAMGDPLIEVSRPPVPIVSSVEALKRRNLPIPIVRSVWIDEGPQTKHILPPYTNMTTVKEFAEYVEDLTRTRPHKLSRRNTQIPHRQRVANALMKAFEDEANQNLISTGALNRALEFLCRNEFLSYVRMIFVRAEHVATVDTYNILLQTSARRQDYLAFQRFLVAMSKVQIKPNDNTWLAFIRLFVSPKVRQSVVSHVIHRGYIKTIHGLRTLRHLTIQENFLKHLESGGSVKAFIDAMMEADESSYFSISMINQLFLVIVRLKHFSALKQLMDICQQHQLYVDSSTLNQIIPLFRADIHKAIGCFQWVMSHRRISLENDTIERLFLVAFKGRCFNICRVLWRYACMWRMVTYKMKQSVLQSLLCNVPSKDGDLVDTLWRVSAGKVIVGIDLQEPNVRLPHSIVRLVPRQFREHPLSFLLSGYRETGEERQAQLLLAQALVYHDIDKGPSYCPRESMEILLEAASLVDREWKNTPRPTQWLLQHAIAVPVEPLSFSHM